MLISFQLPRVYITYSIDTVICMCDGRDKSAAPYYYAILCTLRRDPQAPVDRQAATSLGSPV